MRHPFASKSMIAHHTHRWSVLLTAASVVLTGLLVSDQIPTATAQLTHSSTPQAMAMSPSFLKHTWRLVTWTGRSLSGLGDRRPTLQFSEQRLSGFGGCNRYQAQYRLGSSSRITISAITATRMACTDPRINQQEQQFFSALEAATSIEQNRRGQLVLRARTASGTLQKLTFKKVDDVALPPKTMQTLNGTAWILNTKTSAKPNWVTPQPITLAFTENQVSGFAGCNPFSGSYRQEGDKLRIGDLVATTRGCEPTIMEQESRFLTALSAIQSVQVSDEGLQIVYTTVEGGSGTLRFTRSGGSLNSSLLPDGSNPASGEKVTCPDHTDGTLTSAPTTGISVDQAIQADTLGANACSAP